MGRPRALTDEAAHEVVRRAGKGIPLNVIARHFGVSAELISAIMRGERYGDVTGIAFRGPRPDDVRQNNIDAARALVAEVTCLNCRETAERTVGSVLSSKGSVRCDSCDGRRR